MIDVDFEFRNQNHVSAAGDAGCVGDPSCVAAHHLDNDHAVVRIGSCVNAIHGLGGNGDCGVKAEGGVGAVDVVVDGLGHADAWHSVFAEVQGDRLSVVAAESNERVDFVDLQDFLDLLDSPWNLLYICARGMKDGAPLELNPVCLLQGQRNPLVVEYPPPAIKKSDEHVAVGLYSLSHGGIDHRVQAGAITATGQQSNTHCKSPDEIGATQGPASGRIFSLNCRTRWQKQPVLTPLSVYLGPVKGIRDCIHIRWKTKSSSSRDCRVVQ